MCKKEKQNPLLLSQKRAGKGGSKTHPSPPRRFPGDILAEDFAEHVWRNERDSNYGFAEEYQVG